MIRHAKLKAVWRVWVHKNKGSPHLLTSDAPSPHLLGDEGVHLHLRVVVVGGWGGDQGAGRAGAEGAHGRQTGLLVLAPDAHQNQDDGRQDNGPHHRQNDIQPQIEIVTSWNAAYFFGSPVERNVKKEKDVSTIVQGFGLPQLRNMKQKSPSN